MDNEELERRNRAADTTELEALNYQALNRKDRRKIAQAVDKMDIPDTMKPKLIDLMCMDRHQLTVLATALLLRGGMTEEQIVRDYEKTGITLEACYKILIPELFEHAGRVKLMKMGVLSTLFDNLPQPNLISMH